MTVMWVSPRPCPLSASPCSSCGTGGQEDTCGKSTVMVITVWDTWGEEEEAKGSTEVEDSVGGWNEGSVTFRSVIKRIPINTVKEREAVDQC